MSDAWNTIKDYFNTLPTWGKALIGVAAVGATSHLVVGLIMHKKRKSPFKTDYKPNVVYVFQGPRMAAIPTYSPFAMKLETWLRMAGITYENVDAPIWVRSQEGMLPFVEYNGVEYDDSSFIIRDLTKILKKDSMEASLSVEQKAISRAYEQMMENSTFISFAYIRLTEHMETLFTEQYMGFKLPLTFRLMLPLWKIKKEGMRRLKAQGIGRHPPPEIIGIGVDDLKSISNYLSTKQYFHGDTPTRVDAVLFGFFAQMIYVHLDSPHQKFINTECRNLVRWCDRMKAKYWPDWDEICKTRQLNTWKK